LSNKTKKSAKYDWLAYSQSFLLLAKVACQELEDTREEKHKKITRFDPQNFKLFYNYEDLFISIVYNIKHGIEIFLKTLREILNLNLKYGHDIKVLFEDFKDQLPKTIRPLKDKRGNEIKKEDVDNIPGQLEELENLVIYYYSCKFIGKEGKEVVTIYDKENDVFRYPKNKPEIKINLESVDQKLISGLHEDIDKIYRIFNDLGYILDIYQQNKELKDQ